MTPSRLRKSTKHSGQAIVEFALVMPLLLLILYGTIEISRLIFIYSSVTNAARQAARYGSGAGEEDGVPRYQDCEGIKDVANDSAFIVTFDDINITYDRGTTSDGTQVPISGIDPSPSVDSCPIEDYEVRNGDRIIVQVSASYEPVVPVIPMDPLTIVSSSARTFLVGVPILGSALPTGFAGETSTPSKTATATGIISTATHTATSAPIVTQPPIVIFPPKTQPPALTLTPSKTPLPTRTATITPTPISCSGLTGVTHGPLVINDNYMEMQILNSTGYTLSTAQIYLEWNHDTGHQPGTDNTLRLREASLGNAIWNGDILAPSTYFPDFYPPIPQEDSIIRFEFNQAYTNPDGTERILITIGTPGCTNYPVDSRN
jgi:hypothetical protein